MALRVGTAAKQSLLQKEQRFDSLCVADSMTCCRSNRQGCSVRNGQWSLVQTGVLPEQGGPSAGGISRATGNLREPVLLMLLSAW